MKPITLNAVAWRTIAGLPKLRELATNRAGLGDHAIGQLAGCKTLEVLHLRDEYSLSDRGFVALHGHPNLKHVVLIDPGRTGAARRVAPVGRDGLALTAHEL